MSILLGIWFASIVVIVGIVLYGRVLYSKKGFHSYTYSSIHLYDLITNEIFELYKVFLWKFENVKPHGVRTVKRGLVMAKRGQEIFIHRVYGRVKVEKGRTSSFFLKHISEHKEHTKKNELS